MYHFYKILLGYPKIKIDILFTMLSAKMKVKKVILGFVFLYPVFLYPGIIRQTTTSVIEQKFLGHTFKQVMISGNDEKDEFFIDNKAVHKAEYQERLEYAVKKEQDDKLVAEQMQARTRLQFMQTMQIEIIAKLLDNLLADIAQGMQKIQNPALMKFYVFHNSTIDSAEQLSQLQTFVQQLDDSIAYKIENNDFDGLSMLYHKLELWPARLEKFFQDTVQSAIKKSDDTAMLKELLKLVSELS